MELCWHYEMKFLSQLTVHVTFHLMIMLLAGESKDALFGQFFSALFERSLFFKTLPDGSDDPVRLEKATKIFHEALAVCSLPSPFLHEFYLFLFRKLLIKRKRKLHGQIRCPSYLFLQNFEIKL